MREQLPLARGVLLLPPGFAARWKELERAHGRSPLLADVFVTPQHVVVSVDGVDLVGARAAGDAVAAEQVWEAHTRRQR